MDNQFLNDLIIARRKEAGLGLHGSYNAIVRWLFKIHNVIVDEKYVCRVIQEAKDNGVG